MDTLTQQIATELNKELAGIDIFSHTIENMANMIAQDIVSFRIDEKWAEHMDVQYYDEDKEISVQIGPRDIQFDLNGNKVASGMFMMPLSPPWEK